MVKVNAMPLSESDWSSEAYLADMDGLMRRLLSVRWR